METRTTRIGLLAAVTMLVAGLLVLLPTSPAEAQWSGANGRITFNRGGINYTANPDGTDVRRLSGSEVDGVDVWDGPAAFNPSGTEVVFTRVTRGASAEIYRSATDGSGATWLTRGQLTGDKIEPSWSPDGTQFTYVYGPDRRLAVGEWDGTHWYAVGPIDAGNPSFTPDGTRILYDAQTEETTGNEIFSVPRGGGTPMRHTYGGFEERSTSPDVSPDGTTIVFARAGGCSTCLHGLWVMGLDGSGSRRLPFESEHVAHPRWSPDGTTIVFSAENDDHDRRVHLIGADGTGLTQLDLGAARWQHDDIGSWQPVGDPGDPADDGGPASPPPPGPAPSTTTSTIPADTEPPAITITSPADGATYAAGETVVADYSCSDPSGAPLCHGSVLGQHVPDGAVIDTSVPGVYAFVVESHDDVDPWNFTYRTVVYTVTAPHGSASQEIVDGGDVTTDPTGIGATAESPVQTAISAPAGTFGTLTVEPRDTTTAAPAGYSLFGTETVIEGPVATVEAPYTVTFTVDSSVLGGLAPADVQVLRDGVVVSGCTDPTSAVPDPCVVSRGWAPDGSGDAVVTVRTSHFSTWSLGHGTRGRACRPQDPGRSPCATPSPRAAAPR